MSEPAFNLLGDLDNLLGEITDDDIIRTIATIEEENEKKQREGGEHPAKKPLVGSGTSTNGRFADVTEEDLVRIESGRHEKNTITTTIWAVRLIKSKSLVYSKIFRYTN